MDETRSPFAIRTLRRRLSLPLLAAATLAMGLGGCSSSAKVDELEQRLVQVEAKADAAEKRAKAAESFAARNAPQPFPTPEADPGPNPDGDSGSNEVTDPSADDPAFNNEISAPPPPPVPTLPGQDGSA